MEKKSLQELTRRRDTLDELVDKVRHQSGMEEIWEKGQNALIDKHPYLIGYTFLLGFAILLAVTHLMAFLISFLFLYFISDLMTRDVRRYVPFVPKALLFSILYVVVILSVIFVSYKIVPVLFKNLPELTGKLQVQIVNELKDANEKWGISRFVEIEELKSALVRGSSNVLSFLLDLFKPVYKGFIQFVFAFAINLFLYFESDRVSRVFTRNPRSLLTFLYEFTQTRLNIFYLYFKRVMGGQFLISVINTAISLIAILGLGLPHPFLMAFIVFFCGLFPIVGNLISNSVLIISAFVSIGLWASGVCLLLLVVIHKLEYFLNSRIIGGIVRLPMTVSLAALIFFEVLLGIPGLMLAIPLALFLRHEFEHIPGLSESETEKGRLPEAAAGSGAGPGRR